MKILFTADVHSHEFSDYATTKNVRWLEDQMCYEETSVGEGVFPINSRLLDILNTLIVMREYCVRDQIPNVVIAGDLFHKRANLSVMVFNQTFRVLESFYNCGITVDVLAGNHDHVDNSDIPENSLYGLRHIVNVRDKNETVLIQDMNSDVELVFVPYSKNKDLMLSYVKSYENSSDSVVPILITHVGVDGAFVGKNKHIMTNKIVPEDLMYHKFKYVVMGDYHKPQIVVGTDNMFYTGAPIQHNFNDEGEDRGFWIIDTNKRKHMQFVPIDSPRFITVTKDNMSDVQIEGNFVKVQSSPEDIEEILEMVGDDSVKIELHKEIQEVNRSSISISMDYKDIIKQYAEEQGKADFVSVGLEIYEEALIGG